MILFLPSDLLCQVVPFYQVSQLDQVVLCALLLLLCQLDPGLKETS